MYWKWEWRIKHSLCETQVVHHRNKNICPTIELEELKPICYSRHDGQHGETASRLQWEDIRMLLSMLWIPKLACIENEPYLKADPRSIHWFLYNHHPRTVPAQWITLPPAQVKSRIGAQKSTKPAEWKTRYLKWNQRRPYPKC